MNRGAIKTFPDYAVSRNFWLQLYMMDFVLEVCIPRELTIKQMRKRERVSMYVCVS